MGNDRGESTPVTDATADTSSSVNTKCSDTATCPHKSAKECLFSSLAAFYKAFCRAYGARTALSVVVRAITLARKGPRKIFNLRELFAESRYVSVKFGLFVGVYCSLFRGVRCFVSRLKLASGTTATALAGLAAGSSLLFEDASLRKSYALYAGARALQCWYNKVKGTALGKKLGLPWAFGDSLLFALSSAQVMFAYVMHPETLPPSYLKFIVDTGPIAPAVLKAAFDSNQPGRPVDVSAITNYVASIKGLTAAQRAMMAPVTCPTPAIIPCSVMHPHIANCGPNFLRVWRRAFRKRLSLYLGIHLIPTVLLHTRKLLKQPLPTIGTALFGAARSAVFISSFCAVYQGTVCSHRKIALNDTRYIYWLAGLVCSSAILFERKSRRSELGLYVLPRAVDSLTQILIKRGTVPYIKHIETALFALATSVIMVCLKHSPKELSPLVARLMGQLPV